MMKQSLLIMAILGWFANECLSMELTKKDLQAICNLHFKITVTENKKPPEGVKEFVEGMMALKNITGQEIVADQNIIALHKILSMYTNNVDFKLSSIVNPGQGKGQQQEQQQQQQQQSQIEVGSQPSMNPVQLLTSLLPGQNVGTNVGKGKVGKPVKVGNNNGGKAGKGRGKRQNAKKGRKTKNHKTNTENNDQKNSNICNKLVYPKKVDTADNEQFKNFLTDIGKQSVEIRGNLKA